MTQLILIRHGQTLWNAEKRLQGQRDAPLTEKGILQARAASLRLSQEPLAAVYTSDLGRAVRTAEFIAEPHRLPLVSREDLREVNLGEWEGKSVPELEQDEAEADLLSRWRTDSVTNRPPGGERLEELQARVVRALEEIRGDRREGRVAVVSDGGAIKAAVSWVLGVSLDRQRRFEIHNGSITRIDWTEGKVVIVTLNDTAHWENQKC
jgi:broad specificity phosphatase PhoE